jgi:hypothetical protein
MRWSTLSGSLSASVSVSLSWWESEWELLRGIGPDGNAGVTGLNGGGTNVPSCQLFMTPIFVRGRLPRPRVFEGTRCGGFMPTASRSSCSIAPVAMRTTCRAAEHIHTKRNNSYARSPQSGRISQKALAGLRPRNGASFLESRSGRCARARHGIRPSQANSRKKRRIADPSSLQNSANSLSAPKSGLARNHGALS